MLPAPLYTPISQYNQVANMWINLNMSVADKAGQQSCLGFLSDADSSFEKFDSRLLNSNANNYYNVSGTLICNVLTGWQK